MKRLLLTTISIILLLYLYYSYNSYVENNQFINKIKELRIERDNYMYKSKSSPLYNSEFKLIYFPPNIDFKVLAKIKKLKKIDTIKFLTSTGESQNFLKFAKLEFKLNKNIHELPLYKYLDKGSKNDIFLCFTDKTNAVSTYEGGRYLDISFKNAKRIEIDFNKAYNPYCVYDIKYSCPIPTKENFIDIEILAGEKINLN